MDKKLREHTQFELMSIQERTGVTFIVVTHDQAEAMTLADRITMPSGAPLSAHARRAVAAARIVRQGLALI